MHPSPIARPPASSRFGEGLRLRTGDLSPASESAVAKIGEFGELMELRADRLIKVSDQAALRVSAVGEAARQRTDDLSAGLEVAGTQVRSLLAILKHGVAESVAASERSASAIAGVTK